MGRRPRLTRRTYGQREPAAAALDLLGDRWTLLVVRELVLGPRRWTDLLANLGGIGKNLLSDRLRELEDAGLVTTQVLPWSSSRTRLYQLTESGARLERVLLDLARVGLTRVPASGELRPEWAAFALAATVDPHAEQVMHATIDGVLFTIRGGGGEVRVRLGAQGTPTRELTTTAVDLMSVTGAA